MNEIERLIANKTIPESFLQEEVICDYKVSSTLKAVQAVSLDLLIQLDRVCKKHNIRYFLGYGTLLGAIRHKGFIPWDDDIDVLMLRDDYEKFLTLSNEFEYPYFLQTPETDPGYLFSITKLRNSETCNFAKPRASFGINSGIWIDVFPLDKCALPDRKQIFDEISFLHCFNGAYMRIPQGLLEKKHKQILKKNLTLSPIQALHRITELSTKYRNDPGAIYITDYTSTIFPWETRTWNIDCFSKTVETEFCGRLFSIPEQYEYLLQTLYGDYMKMPPLKERGTWHSGHIIDPYRSYRDVYKELGIELNYED